MPERPTVTDATEAATSQQAELEAPAGPGDGGSGPPPHDPSRIRYYAVPPRPRRWTWVLGGLVWSLLAVVTAVAFGAWIDAEKLLDEVSPNTAAVREAREVLDRQSGEATTFLILGSDRRPDEPGEGARSDTIILMRIDPQREAISLLSIPRDLRVSIPGVGGGRKINEAYAVGGPKLAIETVKQTLGIEVNHWVDVNFQGFFELVQHLGGVYVQVDHRYYNPNVPGARYAPIDLHPGYQLLNGNQALSFVRYRHTDTDFFRADRQQLVMLALKRRAAGRLGISDVPGIMRILRRNIVTDVNDLGTVIDLAKVLLGLPKDRIFRTTLQGTPGPSFVDSGPDQIAASVARYETPPLPGGAAAAAAGRRIPPARIRLVVRNAGAGLLGAERTAEALRKKGYPAVAEGDAPADRPRATAIYFRSNQQRAARQLAAALGGVPANLAPAGQQAPIELIVGEGFPVDQPIAPPKRRPRPQPPAMIADPGPMQAAQSIARIAGLRVLVPTVRPPASRLSSQEGVLAYRLKAGRRGSWPAVVFTFQDTSRIGRYWNVQMTTMPMPPMLEGANVTLPPRKRTGRRYQIIYDGENPRTLAFRQNGVWYWISNTLDTHLTQAEMVAIADGLKVLPGSGPGRARP